MSWPDSAMAPRCLSMAVLSTQTELAGSCQFSYLCTDKCMSNTSPLFRNVATVYTFYSGSQGSWNFVHYILTPLCNVKSRVRTSDSSGTDVTCRTPLCVRFRVTERCNIIVSPLWEKWYLSTFSTRFWLHVHPLSLVHAHWIALQEKALGKGLPLFGGLLARKIVMR